MWVWPTSVYIHEIFPGAVLQTYVQTVVPSVDVACVGSVAALAV